MKVKFCMEPLYYKKIKYVMFEFDTTDNIILNIFKPNNLSVIY